MQAVWHNLKQRYVRFETERLKLLDLSQEIRRTAKSLIHRRLHHPQSDLSTELVSLKRVVNTLAAHLKRHPELQRLGAVLDGFEEYAELIFLEHYYQQDDKLLKLLPADLDHEALIGGIADTSGELVRLARNQLDLGQAERIHQYISELYENFLDLEVSRNNSLRSKMEAMRHNLQKLEEIIFQLRIKKGS